MTTSNTASNLPGDSNPKVDPDTPELPLSDEAESHQLLPESITSLHPPFCLSRPFPAVMNAYYTYAFSVASLKTFKLCGASESDFLYSIEVHTGYSARGPLGTKPGVILHNGTSHKDPVLAAAGDESQTSATVVGFNPRSVVMMPPLAPAASSDYLVTEIMRAATVRGDKGVAFRFSAEVRGGDEVRREEFEWRKIRDAESKKGGFKLLRLPYQPRGPRSSEDARGSSSETSPVSEESGETVALLTWPKGLAWFKLAFTLELQGSGLKGDLGERLALMTVITAIRLWALRVNGKTTKGAVAVSEKVRGK